MTDTAPTKKPKVRGRKKGRRRAALGHDEPHRQCIACRASKPPVQLLRFARHPDGAVVFDVKQKLPGRGAWVCAEVACLAKSCEPKQGGFARAFDAAVVFNGAELTAAVDDAMAHDIHARLGLLRRQGALVLGRDDVVRRSAELAGVALAVDVSANTRHEMEERLPERSFGALPAMAIISAAMGLDRPVGVVGIGKGLAGSQMVVALARQAGLGFTPRPASATDAPPAAPEDPIQSLGRSPRD